MTRTTLIAFFALVWSFFGYVFYQYHYYPSRLLDDALVKAKAGDVKAQALAGDIYLFCSWPFGPDSKAAERNGWENSVILQFGVRSKCNPEEGDKWYRTAAEAGDAQGQFGYGLSLALVHWDKDKEKRKKDKAESRKWLDKAAEQGHPGAIEWLAPVLKREQELKNKPK